MNSAAALLAAAAFLLSLQATRYMVEAARRAGIMDIPNARSSHTVPTPRGGGLAIVAGVMLGAGAAGVMNLVDSWVAIACVVGGGAVAAVGWLDDRKGLSARSRLAVHLGAVALCLVLWRVEHQVGMTPTNAILALAAVVAGAWFVNLYNFMDGIDGLAAGESVVVSLGVALVSYADPAGPDVLCWIVAAASAGFLVLNWPPARIFMGDVGSGFLGLMLGVLFLASWARGVDPWALAILPSVFVADATVTLAIRALRGENVAVAHRQHLYQRLARAHGSHKIVTVLYLLFGAVVLWPLALLCQTLPTVAPIVAAAVYCLLFAVAVRAGAGARDH